MSMPCLGGIVGLNLGFFTCLMLIWSSPRRRALEELDVVVTTTCLSGGVGLACGILLERFEDLHP